MHEHLQILREQYRTEPFGPWHTREAYPWEYDTKIAELIRNANDTNGWFDPEGDEWFRQQAKIFQNRADYIRQRWAEKQAKEEARKKANESFKQHLAEMQANFQAMLTQYSTPPTPPAPQEAHEEEANLEENTEITAEMQEQESLQPLYQATVEDDTETTAKTIPDSPSTLSTIPRLCTTRSSGDPAACFSIAFYDYQHASILGNTKFGYIRCMEGMEASGQG